MMRTDKEIQTRLRELVAMELDRRVEEACARLPHHCRHNHRQPLDVRKSVAGDPNPDYNRLEGKGLPVIGLCLLGADDPTQWKGTICEDPIDAQRCPYYDPTVTKLAVEQEFYACLKDQEWLRSNIPEAHALLWVLDRQVRAEDLPWWKRIWFRLLVKIRPNPRLRG